MNSRVPVKLLSDDRAGRQQPRTLDASAVDLLLQLDVSVAAAVRALRHLRGVAGLQACGGAVQRLLALIPFPVIEVNMTVDQTWQHRRGAEVDHLGAGRNLDPG